LRFYFPISLEKLSAEAIELIVTFFLELRDKMEADKRHAGKKVSTSELLDWFKVLWKHHPEDEILSKLSEKFLYPGALVKSWEDYQRYVLKKD